VARLISFILSDKCAIPQVSEDAWGRSRSWAQKVSGWVEPDPQLSATFLKQQIITS